MIFASKVLARTFNILEDLGQCKILKKMARRFRILKEGSLNILERFSQITSCTMLTMLTLSTCSSLYHTWTSPLNSQTISLLSRCSLGSSRKEDCVMILKSVCIGGYQTMLLLSWSYYAHCSVHCACALEYTCMYSCRVPNVRFLHEASHQEPDLHCIVFCKT